MLVRSFIDFVILVDVIIFTVSVFSPCLLLAFGTLNFLIFVRHINDIVEVVNNLNFFVKVNVIFLTVSIILVLGVGVLKLGGIDIVHLVLGDPLLGGMGKGV
jgi:hypothetical protein